MEPMFLITTTVISSMVSVVSTTVSISARNRAKREITRRKNMEQQYKLKTSANIAKQRALLMTVESRENKIEALQSKISELKTECARLEEVAMLERQASQHLIEAKNNKIEAQNAKMIMLQSDCSRLQQELKDYKLNDSPRLNIVKK